RRACWHMDWSDFCWRELYRRLDHVDRRRDDPVAAIPIAFPARRVGRDIALRCVAAATAARRPHQLPIAMSPHLLRPVNARWSLLHGQADKTSDDHRIRCAVSDLGLDLSWHPVRDRN